VLRSRPLPFLVETRPGRRCAALLATLVAAAVASCTAIRPVPPPAGAPPPAPRTFSHADLDRVLRRFVDDTGRVDYAGLAADAADLGRYYRLVATHGPDSHPALFPTVRSRLAYWINAYNAAVLATVLTHYPIARVTDVRPPSLLAVLPDAAGFFLFQRVTLGGRTTSLYALEHAIIRRRFADPRVHFALNCASRGCPRLPRRAFVPETLDEALDHETRRFVAEARNVAVDHGARAVHLSAIFAWYAEDFLRWYRIRFPGERATLLRYVACYLPAAEAGALRAVEGFYTVRFRAYDWRLNDQAG
jgi:nucleotide-binding universal stress UspA family protein